MEESSTVDRKIQEESVTDLNIYLTTKETHQLLFWAIMEK